MVMIVKMKPTLLLDENNHVDAQKPYEKATNYEVGQVTKCQSKESSEKFKIFYQAQNFP